MFNMLKRKLILTLALIVLAVVGAVSYYAYVKVNEAVKYAEDGSKHLQEAFTLIQSFKFKKASEEFQLAEFYLEKSKSSIDALNGLIYIVGLIPNLATQVEGSLRLMDVGLYTARAGVSLSDGLSTLYDALNDSVKYFSDRGKYRELKGKVLDELSTSKERFIEGGGYVGIALSKLESIEPEKLPSQLVEVVNSAKKQKQVVENLPSQLIGLADAFKRLFMGFDLSMNATDELRAFNLKGALDDFKTGGLEFSEALKVVKEIPVTEGTLTQIKAAVGGVKLMAMVGGELTTSGSEILIGVDKLNSSLQYLEVLQYEESLSLMAEAEGHFKKAEELAVEAYASIDELVKLLGEASIQVSESISNYVTSIKFTSSQLRTLTKSTSSLIMAHKTFTGAYDDIRSLNYSSATTKLLASKQYVNEASSGLREMGLIGYGEFSDAFNTLNSLANITEHLVDSGLNVSNGLESLRDMVDEVMNRPSNWVQTGDETWFTEAKNSWERASTYFSHARGGLKSALKLMEADEYGVFKGVKPLIKGLKDGAADMERVVDRLDNVSTGLIEATYGVYNIDNGMYEYCRGELDRAEEYFNSALKRLKNASDYIGPTNMSDHLLNAINHLSKSSSYAVEACRALSEGDVNLARENLEKAMEEYSLAVEELSKTF